MVQNNNSLYQNKSILIKSSLKIINQSFNKIKVSFINKGSSFESTLIFYNDLIKIAELIAKVNSN